MSSYSTGEQSNDHSQVWMVTSENYTKHVEILSFNVTNKCISYQVRYGYGKFVLTQGPYSLNLTLYSIATRFYVCCNRQHLKTL